MLYGGAPSLRRQQHKQRRGRDSVTDIDNDIEIDIEIDLKQNNHIAEYQILYAKKISHITHSIAFHSSEHAHKG